MRELVEVTDTIIDSVASKGRSGYDCSSCPIALAINKALNKENDARVYASGEILADGKPCKYVPEVGKFVDDFDAHMRYANSDLYPRPNSFSFYLESKV